MSLEGLRWAIPVHFFRRSLFRLCDLYCVKHCDEGDFKNQNDYRKAFSFLHGLLDLDLFLWVSDFLPDSANRRAKINAR